MEDKGRVGAHSSKSHNDASCPGKWELNLHTICIKKKRGRDIIPSDLPLAISYTHSETFHRLIFTIKKPAHHHYNEDSISQESLMNAKPGKSSIRAKNGLKVPTHRLLIGCKGECSSYIMEIPENNLTKRWKLTFLIQGESIFCLWICQCIAWLEAWGNIWQNGECSIFKKMGRGGCIL